MGTISHNPAKITTDATMRTRSLTIGFRARPAWVALALALLLVSACSSARKREEPANIFGNLRYRDSATEDRFSRSYRSGSLYQDFRTVMLADAIAMDMEYRQGFVDMVKRTYMLSDADAASAMRQESQEFDNCLCLLVFLYGGNNRPIPLGDPASPWKVLLQDDDGQMLTPTTIERLRPENPTYQYLNLYFYGLDRWSQAFKIGFPKLNKTLLGQPIGKKPVELIVTGLAGTVKLAWTDPRLFYGAGPAAGGATSQGPGAPQGGKP